MTSSMTKGSPMKLMLQFGLFLLELRHAECVPYGDTGSGLFRHGSVFRSDRDDCSKYRKLVFRGHLRIYSHLLCRPDSMDNSLLLYSYDESLLH